MKTELDVLRDVSQRLESGGVAFMLKLYWARESKSELQLRDVRNLLSSDCDMTYLFNRAESLGVKPSLEEIVGAHE